MSLRRLEVVRLCIVAMCVAGCSARNLQSSGPELVAPPGKVRVDRSYALSVDEVRVYEDGIRYFARGSFVDRIMGALRTSTVFDEIYGPAEAHLAPDGRVRAVCWVDTDLETHELSNLYSGLALVFSFGLLSPVFQQRYEVLQRMECTLLLPTGSVRKYASSAAGVVRHYELFPDDVEAEVTTVVTDKNLKGVVGMIIADFSER